MSDYDRMRQRHHDGMCGGDCSECWKQQEQEARARAFDEAAEEWAREQAQKDAVQHLAKHDD